MTTVNISITDDQLQWMDRVSDKLGFANRSEFVRSLLRFAAKDEKVLQEVETFPFQSPSSNNINEVVDGFSKSGKYSKAFLSDLKKGLKRSTYFK
jgi:Arc/MetJ-type ribon-helix-helix transcriptional regulator